MDDGPAAGLLLMQLSMVCAILRQALPVSLRAGRVAQGARVRIAVTGSTGYVGAFSVKALVDAGHGVRLLVRDPAKAQAVLRAIGVTGRLDCVNGDMTDEASVLKALQGCDAALHCAAVVSTRAAQEQAMLRANPRGVELVIGHAARLGLDPIVHCSSVTALLRPGAKVLTADTPAGTLTRGYAGSKVLCEQFVRKLQREGAPVVITYPGGVTGPAAGRILGEATLGVAATVRSGLLPTREAALTIIDARDLGAIHTALMTSGRGPRRIVCGGHFLTPPLIARHLHRLTGRKFLVLPVPAVVLRGASVLLDAVSRILPRLENPFTHEAMVYFTQMPPTDDSAVVRELGIRYRDIEETLRESILAARDAGLLTNRQLGRLAHLRHDQR